MRSRNSTGSYLHAAPKTGVDCAMSHCCLNHTYQTTCRFACSGSSAGVSWAIPSIPVRVCQKCRSALNSTAWICGAQVTTRYRERTGSRNTGEKKILSDLLLVQCSTSSTGVWDGYRRCALRCQTTSDSIPAHMRILSISKKDCRSGRRI
jgi:hypothetical protein